MWRFFLILLLNFSLLSAAAGQQDKDSQPQRPKVALVLSGGGVKGAAHVGLLKAVEEAGLPVDLVVGTSMGAIVGGLYAMGYSPEQLDSLFRSQDWRFILSDKAERSNLSIGEREKSGRYLLSVPFSRSGKSDIGGFLRGQNLKNLLTRLTVGYHDSISYDRLPIPFACVATNLSNGQEIIFRSGVPAMSIRASMSIPGVFTPVKYGGMTLVDGGLVNNFPVDVARALGADIVIGSMVQKAFNDTTQFSSVPNILEQVISISCRNKYEENIRLADLAMRMPVTDFSTMDFSTASIDTILKRGYETACQYRASLDSLRHLTMGTDSLVPAFNGQQRLILAGSSPALSIRRVFFDGMPRHEAVAVARACHLGEDDSLSFTQIEEALRLLRDKFLYADAGYSLTEIGNDYDLHFQTSEKSVSKVGIGARFDTEEMAAVLLGADFTFNTKTPSQIGFAGKLGEQYYVRLNYSVEPAFYRQFGVAYEFSNHDFNVNRQGQRAYNLCYRQHTAEIACSNLRIRNLGGELGVRTDYFDFDKPTSGDAELATLKSCFYFSAYIRLKYNSQDAGYYPTRGSNFQADLAYTTDDLSYLRRPHGFTTLSASWEGIVTLHKRWALLPRLAGRMVWGQDIPLPFRTAYGGNLSGRYLTQQIAFTGVSNPEFAQDVFLTAAANLRYNIAGRHFATALFNLAAETSKLEDIHRARHFYGIGLKYGYNSKFGPIEATFSYSDNTKKLLFHLGVGYYF